MVGIEQAAGQFLNGSGPICFSVNEVSRKTRMHLSRPYRAVRFFPRHRRCAGSALGFALPGLWPGAEEEWNACAIRGLVLFGISNSGRLAE